MAKKRWYQSKTKWGALLLALGHLAPAAAAALGGDWAGAAPVVVEAVGLAAAGFGVRDALGQ